MSRLISVLVLMLSLQNISCENKASVQDQNNLAVKSSPAPTSQEENANQEGEAIPEWKKHFWKALNLRTAGKHAEAIEEYKKAIESGHDDKEIYREIALILISLNRYEEAVAYLRKVLEKDPKDPAAHWALARVFVENLEKYEEGLKEAELAQEFYGKDGLSYVRDRIIGKAYDRLGNYENALKHYKIFLRGRSYAPDSDDYKEIQKRVSELEKVFISHSGKSP